MCDCQNPSKSCFTALPLLLLCVVNTSIAEQPPVLEEVVVTAQKRQQGLIDVPISISVIDADFIQDRNLLTLAEVTQYAPNVSVTEQVLGFNVVSMRGFSGGANRGFEQSVGRYVDGVFSGRTAASSSDLNDIERVEILRGPQGTLFGNNTIAGSFNIITRATNPESFEGNLIASAGSYDHRMINGTVSGPIADAVSFRISLGHRQQSGATENLAYTLGEADRTMGDLDKNLWRVKLNWQPSDSLSLVLATSGENAASNMAYGSETFLSRPGDQLKLELGPISVDALPVLTGLVPDISFALDDRIVAHNENTQFELSSRMHSLTVDYVIGEHQLKSITAFGNYDDDNLFDADFSPVDLLARRSEESYQQVSQEVQWISPQYDNFNFVLGLFWLSTNLNIDSSLEANFNGYGVPVSAVDIKYFEQDYRSSAAYGQGTYQLSYKWSVTGGLRYSIEKKSADIVHTYSDCYFLSATPLPPETCGTALGTGEQYALDSSLDDSNTSPMLSLGYHINDQWNSYARYAQGYKSGGFSAEDFYLGDNNNQFEPEQSTTYEAGVKGSFLDGAAWLSAAIFYTRFNNLQVSLFNGVGFTVGNAAEAHSQGFEMDTRWLATEALMLSASLGYTDAKYDDYANAPCTVDQIEASSGSSCYQDLAGETLARAPKWNASGSMVYSLPMTAALEWQFGLDLVYSDAYYTDIDLDENTYQGAYTLVNARISLGAINDRWQVMLRGTNLGDETVMTGTVDLPFLHGAYGGRVTPPRSYFIDVKASF